MSDHMCMPTSSEESSYITKTRSVVLTANRKSTWSIASALDVPYNRALYNLYEAKVTARKAADYGSRQMMVYLRQCIQISFMISYCKVYLKIYKKIYKKICKFRVY